MKKKTEKKEKIALGLFLDGLNLKVAECHLRKGTIVVQQLKEFRLKEALGEIEDHNNLNLSDFSSISSEASNISFSEPKDSDESLQGLDDIDDFMGINDDEEFTHKTSTEPEQDYKVEEKTEEVLPQYDLNSSKYFEVSRFLSNFPLNKSSISFVTTEEKLFWNYIPFSSKKIKKEKIKKQSLTKEQKKKSNVQFDILMNSNKSAYSLVYEGTHDVISLIENVQPLLGIKSVFYNHAEPLEITLINAVLSEYDFPEDQYTLILYLSKDYKIAIITQNNNFIKSFPLIIQASDPDIIREAIISKIMLEQDISAVNITQNVIICGDYTTREDVNFFNDNFKSNFISIFKFSNGSNPKGSANIEFDINIPESMIPRFIPSISLCLRSMSAKNKKLHHINLLPQLLLDKQKFFKLRWHGFAVIGLIFVSTMWTTFSTLQGKIELRNIQSENQKLEFVINQKKAFQNILQQFTTQLDAFESNRKSIVDLIQKKNQWAYIIEKISNFTSQHAYFWIKEIRGSDSEIRIQGYAYNRNNISSFSNVLPLGSIKKILLTKIEDETVWDFEILFAYPDPTIYNPLFSEIKVELDTLITSPAVVDSLDVNKKEVTEKAKETSVKKEVTAKPVTPVKAEKEKKVATPVKEEKAKETAVKKEVTAKPVTPVKTEKEKKVATPVKEEKTKETTVKKEVTAKPVTPVKTEKEKKVATPVKEEKAKETAVKKEVSAKPVTPVKTEKEKKVATPVKEEKAKETAVKKEVTAKPVTPVKTEKEKKVATPVKEEKAKETAVKKEVTAKPVTPVKTEKEKKVATPVKEEKAKETAVKKDESKVKNKKDNKKDEIKNQDSYKYIQARIMVQKANYDSAIVVFREFLKENPNHRLVPMAYFLIGESFFNQQDYDQAIMNYQKVLNLKKVKMQESLFNIGNSYSALNQNDKAIKYYEELIRRYPNTVLLKQAQDKLLQLKGE